MTNRTVQHLDREEEGLSEATGVTVRIYDGKYIAAHINDDARTKAAFENHLRYLTDFLKTIGSSSIGRSSIHVQSAAVFVFLRQELDRRSGDVSLVDAVIDSLVLWALEGTDPDRGILMTAADVEAKILGTIPSSKSIVHGHVVRRLQSLAAKSYPGGRQVRWHTKVDSFCLPFQTRQRIEDENLEDESLRLRVLNGLYARAASDFPNSEEGELRRSAEVTLRSLQLVFEREGLEFASFISGESEVEPPTIGDAVRDSLAEHEIYGADAVVMARICLAAARGCVYQSTEYEREYLGKLARTYSLLFTLNTEPRLVQYFQEMAGDFYLYVGADLIVRALSERYLAQPDQLVTNTLRISNNAGARLILTEPVLDEVVSHLRATDSEFRNHFRMTEHRVTEDIASQAPKILVRTYFYSRLVPSLGVKPPKNWDSFIGQFCEYKALFRPEAYADVRRYLQSAFGMEYLTADELGKMVDAESVKAIADVLEQRKGNRTLAENDALLACAVYGHRKIRRESFTISEFGYQTWWLTGETTILRYTADMVKANEGQKYMMRPEFLLNYLAFVPAAAEARQAFRNIFLSPLGIKLSQASATTGIPIWEGPNWLGELLTCLSWFRHRTCLSGLTSVGLTLSEITLPRLCS